MYVLVTLGAKPSKTIHFKTQLKWYHSKQASHKTDALALHGITMATLRNFYCLLNISIIQIRELASFVTSKLQSESLNGKCAVVVKINHNMITQERQLHIEKKVLLCYFGTN